MSKSRKHNIHLGGGAMEEFSPSVAKSSGFFKPIVATSLALALGFSVASATTTCTGTNGAPSICLGSETTDSSNITSSNKSFKITWNDSSGGNSNIYEMTTSAVTANGNFAFYLEGSSQNNGGVAISNNNGYKAQIDNSISSLTINGNGKSIKMGSSGNGTLGLGGGSGKTVTLDLSGVTTANYALYGNLFIGAWGTGEVNATFGGKGISGEIKTTGGNNTITFKENAESKKIWIHAGSNTITFEKNATISSGSEVIYSGNKYDGTQKGYGTNIFYFKGSANKIENTNGATGQAVSVAGGAESNKSNTFNKLYFENGENTIIGKVYATTFANTGGYGLNHIEFKENTTTNLITGNIQTASLGQNELVFKGSVSNRVDGDIVGGGGGNTLSFEAGTNQIGNVTGGSLSKITFTSATTSNTIASIKGRADVFFGTRPTTQDATITASGSAASTITNGISVRDESVKVVFASTANATIGNLNNSNNAVSIQDGGANSSVTLDFYGNTLNAINGGIISKSNQANGKKQTNITFHSGTTNTISGDVNATDLATNTISFGGTTNQITGSISSNSNWDTLGEGANTIRFTNTNGSNTIGGSITANAGSNTLTFNGVSNTITGNISTSSGKNHITMTASGTNAINTISGNITSSLRDSGNYAINHNNYILTSGTATTLGLASQAISISIDNSASSGASNHNRSSNNTIVLGANKNDVYVSKMSTAGSSNTTPSINFNALSLNNATDTGARTITTFLANSGNNIVGKDLATNSSTTGYTQFETPYYNDNLFAVSNFTLPLYNRSVNTVRLKDNFATTFMSSTYTAKGSITIGSAQNTNAISATNGGNYINIENVSITGSILANSGSNYIMTNALTITSGSISASGNGVNNITASNGTLTINGISTKDWSGTSGNTLNLGSATLTINASGDSDAEINGKAIYAKNGSNTNAITAQTITINAEMYANSEAINSISGERIEVAGNISKSGTAQNNFALTADNSTLTLKGATNQISTLTAYASAINGNTLTLDASTNDNIVASINTLNNSERLKINLNGGAGKSTHLTLNTPSAMTLKSLSVTGIDNTLTLNGAGETTIEEGITLSNDKGITFDLRNGADLNFANGLNLASGNASFNLDGENVIKGTPNSITSGTLTFNFEGNSSMLTLQNSNGVAQTLSTSLNTTNINFNHDGVINGSVSTTLIGTTNIVVNNNAYAVIDGSLTTGDITRMGTKANAPSTNVTLNSGALVVKGEKNSISNLTLGDGNATLSLTDYNGNTEDNRARRNIIINTLTTGSGDLTLATKATASSADTFTIKSIDNSNGNQGTYRFGISLDGGVNLTDVGAHEAVLVARIESNTAGIVFEDTAKVVGDFIEGSVEIDTRESGGNTDYYLGKVLNANIILAEQAVTATAFTLNYDLYMANLNSLNKRMGELRDNAHSQGVWARVFNGALSNTSGLGSKSNYTTIQAGYDYAFGFEGANNYLGVALSYALSTSSADYAYDSNGHKRGIDNIYSNAVEVALYNSYVSDSGWYNDSIAKFSYLMSSFDISRSSEVTSNDTTNFAFTLSDEVGYVFKLGGSKEWSITPQFEATFGYFNQSDFKQTLQSNSTLNSIAESVLTLRSRVGSSFGYDFKKFTQGKGFNASLYVGAFYEYDYVSGGEITMDSNAGITSNELSDISSDGRVVMNVGTNMSIKDNTRIYFDFEKSFAGKITTDYQVNVGVRYSFGENAGYTPMLEKKSITPLKVSDENPSTKTEDKEGESEKTAQEQVETPQESKAQ